MRRTLLRILIVLAASCAVGVVVNIVRTDVGATGEPRRLPWLRPPGPDLAPEDQIARDEAEQLWNAGLGFFLDARSPADYAAGHIALAHNLPAHDFEQFYPLVAGLLAPDAEIVVYCDGVECDLSHQLTAQLRARGYDRVRVLVNGWTLWRQAGLPTKTGAGP